MSIPYVGEIKMFGGSFAPVGWELCHGQLLSISEQEVLFALIGTTYGGDGQTTFAVPDLRSRVPIGRSVQRQLGALGGAESVTLTAQQLPAHSHTTVAGSAKQTSSSPAGRLWAASGSTPYSSQPAETSMSSGSLAPAGNGTPHENRPPYMAVNFIIATQGIFPSQE